MVIEVIFLSSAYNSVDVIGLGLFKEDGKRWTIYHYIASYPDQDNREHLDNETRSCLCQWLFPFQ